MKRLSIVLIGLVLLLTACKGNSNIDENTQEQQIPDPVEETQQQEQKEEPVIELTEEQEEYIEETVSFLENIERATSLDYEKVASEAREKGYELAPDDEDLRKWIIRLYIYNIIQSGEVPETLLEDAKAAKERREGWLNYVESKYQIYLTTQEVNDYISEVTEEDNENTKAIAKGLNMNVEYMNYEYERDQYVQQLKWKKLLPILEEKYPQEEDEDDDAYLQRLNNEFNKELDKYLGE